ncbi:MAG: galactokinase, partial [Acidobacteriaceae bacterium]|nr:galactokinase [Acidobacteriaceae bacterium]
SLNLEQGREWDARAIPDLTPQREWSDYVIGVARQIPQLAARDIMVYSTVPVGAGLSSSASLEVSTALASGWHSETESKLELAKLCRRAENDFVGLPSGIMDQYVSVFRKENAAVMIDCRSLEHKTVQLPENVAIVAVNSLVKHQLSQGAYRNRVAECRRAAQAIGVESLRDATLADLEKVSDETARKRARHVITENARVLEFQAASERGNLEAMGRLFVESHRSLQHDYEVSCAELDFLVDEALATEGVVVARMTGGGFGGCTVNLLDPAAVDAFEQSLRRAYESQFGKSPAFYRVRPAAGAGKIS